MNIKTIFKGILILYICDLTLSWEFQMEENFNKLVMDITEDCQKNYTTNIHLPYGAGPADARIIILRSTDFEIKHCSILIVGPHVQNSCEDNCMTVFVVEIFNQVNTTLTLSNCGIFLKSKNKQFADVCTDIRNNMLKHNGKEQLYTYLVHKEPFIVDIHMRNFFGTIKMTATAAKYLGNSGNCTEDEIYCIVDGQVFCIDKLLECDNNLNCGTPNMYDEYCNNFFVPTNIVFVILYGTILMAVILYFFIQLLRVWIPTVSDHFFIFNEDEEFNFVLTTQSLPPLKFHKHFDDKEKDRQEKIRRGIENQIF